MQTRKRSYVHPLKYSLQEDCSGLLTSCISEPKESRNFCKYQHEYSVGEESSYCVVKIDFIVTSRHFTRVFLFKVNANTWNVILGSGLIGAALYWRQVSVGRRKESGSTLLKKNSLLLKPAMDLPPRVHPLKWKQGQCVSVFLSLCLPETLYCMAFEHLSYRHASQRVHFSSSSNFFITRLN